MDDSIIGDEIDGYRIQEVLGQGGMGVVYRAEDVALSREVALKCINRSLSRDESFLRRFRSEAQALARVDSPYIVQVHTLSRLEIGLVIVMEYVEGGNLKQQISPGGTPWAETLPFIRQMLTALEHAHAADVTHRDVKPHNILLSDTATAHGNRVKMTDFGLAKINTTGDRSRTVTEGVYGSLNYMSPEQVEGLGGVDPRSDLYSLGMTIYEMLAGRLPFPDDGTTYKIMRTIVEEDLPPLDAFVDDVPAAFTDIVMKALEKDPDDRFQSAAEMKRAIDDLSEQVLPEDDPSVEPAGAPSSPAPPRVETSEPPTAEAESHSESDGSAGFRPPSRIGRMAGLVVVLGGLLVGAGYLASDASFQQLFANERTETTEASSSPPPQDLPPVLESLVPITDAGHLEQEIDDRVESGDLIKGTGPEDFFVPSEKCYVFVLDSTSTTVEAVIDTGTVRVDLRSGTAAPSWSERYANRPQLWVALPQ